MAYQQLIFTSRPVVEITDNTLSDILMKAHENNSRQKVSGFLAFLNGNFIQFMEGSPEVVDALFERIKQDNRHTDVQRALHQLSEQKLFPAWFAGLATDATHRELLGKYMFCMSLNDVKAICATLEGSAGEICSLFFNRDVTPMLG